MTPIPTETPSEREKRSTEYPEAEAAAIVATLSPEEADRFCTVREAVETIPGKPGTPVMVEPERHYQPGHGGMEQPSAELVPHPRGKTEGGTPTVLGCNAKYDMRTAVKLARLEVHRLAALPGQAENAQAELDRMQAEWQKLKTAADEAAKGAQEAEASADPDIIKAAGEAFTAAKQALKTFEDGHKKHAQGMAAVVSEHSAAAPAQPDEQPMEPATPVDPPAAAL